MSKSNHIFSFAGGEILAQIGAWWFVSYSYYKYVDRNHLNWSYVKTESSRRNKYEKSTEYHTYWLTEVLSMERLDVHGNSGNLTSKQIKEMAKKILDVVSSDGGQSAIQEIIDKLQAQYDYLKNKNRD